MNLKHDQLHAINLARLEQVSLDARNRLQAVMSVALTALRTLVLINGGAVGLLLTVVTKSEPGSALSLLLKDPAARSWLYGSALTYAAGVALALGSIVCGYFIEDAVLEVDYRIIETTYREIMRGTPLQLDRTRDRSVLGRRRTEGLHWLAAIFAVASLLAFLAGTATGLRVILLSDHGGGPAACPPPAVVVSARSQDHRRPPPANQHHDGRRGDRQD